MRGGKGGRKRSRSQIMNDARNWERWGARGEKFVIVCSPLGVFLVFIFQGGGRK